MEIRPVPTAGPLLAERTAYVGFANDMEALDPLVGLPSPHFVLFFAADSRQWPHQQCIELARRFLDAGAAYVCAWGPGAAAFHTSVDEAFVNMELEKGHEIPVIMTTGHEKQTLREALWFAAQVAYPDDYYEDTCRSLVALVVGERSWLNETTKYLSAGAPFHDEA
jgi:hypothetical protein